MPLFVNFQQAMFLITFPIIKEEIGQSIRILFFLVSLKTKVLSVQHGLDQCSQNNWKLTRTSCR